MELPSWLVSYPKSGTTWMRFLVAHLIGPPPEGSADLTERLPSIHEGHDGWTERLDQPGWLATHKSFPAHAARYSSAMPRLVHIVRHPADALLSAARYFCLTQASSVQRREGAVDSERLEQVLRDYLQAVLTNGKVGRHQRVGMGSWGEHTASWLERHREQPTFFVRYEDLVADTPRWVGALARFLDAGDVDAGAIAAQYALGAMRDRQEAEIRSGTRGQFFLGPEHQVAYDLGLRFVGRGAIGAGLQLGPTAMERLEGHFGPVMARLGYTTDPARPVAELPAAPGLVAS